MLCSFSADSYTIYGPGNFTYNCSGVVNVQGKFSVVRGSYGVVLCGDCPQEEHTVQQGFVLYWSYGEKNMMCTPVVQHPGGQQPVEMSSEGGRSAGVYIHTAWEQSWLHKASIKSLLANAHF